MNCDECIIVIYHERNDHVIGIGRQGFTFGTHMREQQLAGAFA